MTQTMVRLHRYNNGIAPDVAEAIKNLENVIRTDEEGILKNTSGEIWLIPSMDLYAGSFTHDIDILIIGRLDGCFINVEDFSDIEVKSFITTIEVKRHNIEGVASEKGDLLVRYNNAWHNVSKQSSNQRTLMINALRSVFPTQNIPFVTNLIYLTGVDYDTFNEQFCPVIRNVITSNFTVYDLLEAICIQTSLRNGGYVDAFRGKVSYDSVVKTLCARCTGADTVTLRKLNAMALKNENVAKIEKSKEQVIVLSGRAGTGKTIMLLKAALDLSQTGKKCLFVTYNTALVSDIKHTLSYIPKSQAKVDIKSMHSYLCGVMAANQLFVASDDNSEFDNQKFREALATLNDRLSNGVIKRTKHYDYVFIDEAQDWSKDVVDVVKGLFADSRIVIADGVDQFMQSVDNAVWGRPSIPILKKCLRQRSNLTKFAQIFASKMGIVWDIQPNEDMPGGKVMVCKRYDIDIHNILIEDLKKHGCKEYDMMFLVPNSMIKNERFAKKRLYERSGIHVFDGIDSTNRSKGYDQTNAQRGECRVFTYESCRGLEAWTTVCHRFDELFDKEHPHAYNNIPYKMARRYMQVLWSLIPLTRAINTLVLRITNPESEVAVVIDEIHREYPDLIEYIENSRRKAYI